MNSSLISADLSLSMQYLYSLDARGIRPGLERTIALLERLGNPQNSYPSIHIAGTNGKGSTCAIIVSILQAAGYRTGLYTSPHLLKFNERIRINGEKITDEKIESFIQKSQSWIDETDCTFFEATTAMAFDYFREKRIDIAVLEVGMGGQFDATNVVIPKVSVITPIGKDHQEFLGNTLSKIAFEKAGIGKANVPCIVSRQRPVVKRELMKDLDHAGIPFFYSPDLCRIKPICMTPEGQWIELCLNGGVFKEIHFPLVGDHQLINLQTALSAVHLLNDKILTDEMIVRGIESTVWPGRMQILSKEPLVIYDVGHNLHGIRQVIRSMKRLFPDKNVEAIIALGSKKQYNSLAKWMKCLGGRVYLTEIPGCESVPVDELKREMLKALPASRLVVDNDLPTLLNKVNSGLSRKDVLLIVGSHYLAPIVLPFYKISV